MRAEVRDAGLKWGLGLGVGLAPLLAHAVAGLLAAVTGRGPPPPDFSAELLFVVFATAGGAILVVLGRLAVLRWRRSGLSRSLLLLIGLNLALLAAGAALYGAFTVGEEAANLQLAAAGLAVGGCVCSLYLRLALAAVDAPDLRQWRWSA